MKQTEQRIKFAEVDFPGHVSPACRSFIQQVSLTVGAGDDQGAGSKSLESCREGHT